MQTIAYYISDYGYGHATRCIAIIRELIVIRPDLRVIVCTSFSMDFIKQSMAPYSQVQYRNVNNDIGYFLQQGSLEPDITKLKEEYRLYIESVDERVQKEVDFLLELKVELVISDIAPIPFISASSLGIPSVGLSNFTWYTAYRNWLTEYELVFLKNAYSKMDHYLAFGGANEPLWGRLSNDSFQLVSRELDMGEVARIRDEANIEQSKMLVYVGLGMKVNMNIISSWKIWDSTEVAFIVSSSHGFNHPNVTVIPHHYLESQNYVAACDLIITKAGWGTASEAVLANRPLLILKRNDMNEDKNTIRYLKHKRLCSLKDWDDLRVESLTKDQINQIINKYNRDHTALNDKQSIVQRINEIIEMKHRRHKL
ncbi:glycosyltransferase [Paenibacillus hexagrammi]|uniref:Glycosyl transferase family 28 C-terminal domain-containing protein n=1 Tax=Paenibacillus hexagrammi TaxID=2908839 RepID=A0ABY3SM81_9BACL|nr:glycosyltransferase [Paenibacillus sp. YPD9-1]UJF34329.1 hypothetical protein L0M14_03710 [Paenibacillus sp. YPD9-1]